MSALPTDPPYDIACDISDNWSLEQWKPILETICVRHDIHGIKFSQNLEGTNPVFEVTLTPNSNQLKIFNKAYIIKILAPNFRPQYQGDYYSLKLLNHHHLGIKVPKLIYSGDVDNWPYLVIEKLDGIMLSSVLDTLSHENKIDIARALGDFSAQLHALPEELVERLRVDWPDLVQRQTLNCYEKRKRQGLATPLLESINTYLQRHSDKLAPNLNKTTAHLIHTDLHPGNLLVTMEQGQYKLSGIIDFGDALACADPTFEFTSPALLLALGEASIFHAYLDGYGYKGLRDSNLQQHMMVLNLLRHTGDIDYLLQHVPNCQGVLDWEELEPLFFPL